eukprot:gnl/TRDRNA2_/TRDRNA2_195270_c0_seq1.p1 gnl/TRDRNA2_/TRDRNA2_195270_c0~~gnl/TRDRNA2_/TRDRNA2_195270_c0_seq1.p1  ORF type:complete len:339 (-),score=41.45 gnl/TRDRNA2_/TRDRNA2_195270_c0_seq1:55-1071(-)
MGPREETPPPQPVTLGDMTSEQEAQLRELQRRLEIDPEPEIREHVLEGREARLLRFLRSEHFNIDAAVRKLHAHSKWWKDYGMDEFSEEDELDENGPMFVCGVDRQGQPTIIARPCVHFPVNREESIRIARRCIYTMQRCIERMQPGYEQVNVIYDAKGVQSRNVDHTFAREVIEVFGGHFPGRMARLLVINSHWSLTFFWLAVGPMLSTETRSNILFCGADFSEALAPFVSLTHPYVQYALKVKDMPAADAAAFPLPSASPYAPSPRLSEGAKQEPCRLHVTNVKQPLAVEHLPMVAEEREAGELGSPSWDRSGEDRTAVGEEDLTPVSLFRRHISL